MTKRQQQGRKNAKPRRPSGNCKLCGVHRESLHRDHVTPKWAGGTDDETNVQYICANCHEDKTRREAKMLWSDQNKRDALSVLLTAKRAVLRGQPSPKHVQAWARWRERPDVFSVETIPKARR